MTMRYDEVGYWSEIKLDIVRQYAGSYSTILSAQRNPALTHIYVDAFAGPGVHISRQTGQFIQGSPLNALNVDPPFKEYHFIDIEGAKIESLRELVGDRADVFTYQGDCNEIMTSQVFPRAQFSNYRRALCLLDPYGLHLDWNLIQTAGSMHSIDLFLNFPVMDMNMNILWTNPAHASPAQVERMNRYWGDDSWKAELYDPRQTLFDLELKPQNANDKLSRAFRERLRQVAGFSYVPLPLPMRNSTGAIVYYLYFASQKPVAENIVRSIFQKYRGMS
ncbi:MAG TPA: three-Cys-motif partner protein TcmP [Dehalococcoidia bacterium]|nr:three-Cys-motif partner protein TcmP [Dehalococcoidia bacterium]